MDALCFRKDTRYVGKSIFKLILTVFERDRVWISLALIACVVKEREKAEFGLLGNFIYTPVFGQTIDFFST